MNVWAVTTFNLLIKFNNFLILLLDLTIKFTFSMVYTTPYINFKALRHVARHRFWNKNSISYTEKDTLMHLQGPYCRKIQQSNCYWFLFHYFIFSLKYNSSEAQYVSATLGYIFNSKKGFSVSWIVILGVLHRSCGV